MKTNEKIAQLGALAKAKGKSLLILDVRYNTLASDYEIGDEYIYVSQGQEVLETGKIGGKPKMAEPLGLGGKLIMLSAVISIEIV